MITVPRHKEEDRDIRSRALSGDGDDKMTTTIDADMSGSESGEKIPGALNEDAKQELAKTVSSPGEPEKAPKTTAQTNTNMKTNAKDQKATPDSEAPATAVVAATASATGTSSARSAGSGKQKSSTSKGRSIRTDVTDDSSNALVTPGAVFVPNPLGASSTSRPAVTALITADSSYVQPAMELSRGPTIRATRAPVRIETELIVVATQVSDESGFCQDSENGGVVSRTTENKKKTLQCFVGGALALGIGVALVLLLVILPLWSNPTKQPLQPSTSSPSPAPLPYPTADWNERRASFIGILSPFVVSDPSVFDPESPNASSDRIAALDWLVVTDLGQIEIPSPDDTREIQKLRQRFVLALFYYATKGDNWENQFFYLSHFDECTWNSVRSAKDGFYSARDVDIMGTVCNADGNVTELLLYWNNLEGTLPPELSYFKDSLTALNIGGGKLEGTIPESFGDFEVLESVGLHDHCLTGTIPERLPEISSVAIFSTFNNNGLVGSLSDSLCDGPVYKNGTIVVAVDNCNTNLTDDDNYGIDCECCSCCDPDKFVCDDPKYGSFSTLYLVADKGHVRSFAKNCLSAGQKEFIQDECPCLVVRDTSKGGGSYNYCTTDCTEENAQPAYDFSKQERRRFLRPPI